MLLWSQLLFDFSEILRRGSQNVRMLLVNGQSPMTHSPILPQFLTPIMHFQWEGPNTAIMRPVDRLWCLRAQTTCLGAAKCQKL